LKSKLKMQLLLTLAQSWSEQQITRPSSSHGGAD